MLNVFLFFVSMICAFVNTADTNTASHKQSENELPSSLTCSSAKVVFKDKNGVSRYMHNPYPRNPLSSPVETSGEKVLPSPVKTPCCSSDSESDQ